MKRPDKPKRILMLLENSGIPEDTRVTTEAKTLIRNGFEVTIICPTRKSRKWAETIEGMRVYRYPSAPEGSGFLNYLFEYGYSLCAQFCVSLFVLFRRGFDVVHVHTPPDMMCMIAIFYQLLGKKFVFDHHDLSPELYLARRGDDRPNLTYKVLRFFERLACRRADRLIATNETQRNVQLDRCGALPQDCFVVRNGPTERFLNGVEPRQELLKPGKSVLGFVGGLGIQDGVDYMVHAVHEIKVRNRRTDFLAVIVGNGPQLNSLKALAQELDVADLIEFTGAVPFESVPAYIAAFDICLTPDPSNAYNDSCSTIKTMEYMALRKPVVCFRTRENEVTAGEAALYAEDNDVAKFAQQVIRLMDDANLRKRMGEIGRKRIDDGLSWRYQAAQLLATYDDLFDCRPTQLQDSAERGTPAMADALVEESCAAAVQVR